MARASPPRPFAIARALSAVAHGSCDFMVMFAVRMRLRLGFVTIVELVPSSGAGMAFGAPLAASTAVWSVRPEAVPPPADSAEDWPTEAHAAASSTTGTRIARTRAGPRMVFTCFRVLSRQTLAGRLGSLPADPEEFAGVFGHPAAQAGRFFASGGGDRGERLNDERRLVPPATARLWGQVRSVRLDQDSVGRDARGRSAQRVVLGIRERACEGDGEAATDPLVHVVGPFAEAVHHPTRAAGAIDQLPRQGTGLAHMHDDGQVERARQGELRDERGLLRLARRAAAGKIDADLADRDHVRVLRQPIHHARYRLAPRRGPMRVDTDRDAHRRVTASDQHAALARCEILRT